MAEVQAAPEERLWSVDDVCRYLGIEATSTSGKRTALSRLRVPSVRIGGRVRFIPGEIRRWAASQKAS